jgi:hypothetical protein
VQYIQSNSDDIFLFWSHFLLCARVFPRVR